MVYGIKQIAKLTGFSWRDTDPGGANSIAWYNDYLGATMNALASYTISLRSASTAGGRT